MRQSGKRSVAGKSHGSVIKQVLEKELNHATARQGWKVARAKEVIKGSNQEIRLSK